MSLTIPSISRSERYVEPLLQGDRAQCRKVIEEALFTGVRAYDLLTQLIWPTMELLQAHFREDRISQSTLNLATLLNRSMTDQVAARLERKPSNNKKVLIFCGNGEPEELGGRSPLSCSNPMAGQRGLPAGTCRKTKCSS